MPISYPYTSVFKRIRILDSTAFQLPDIFSSIYPDAGGCDHTAGVKIQLEYDLLSGQFLHIHTGQVNNMIEPTVPCVPQL